MVRPPGVRSTIVAQWSSGTAPMASSSVVVAAIRRARISLGSAAARSRISESRASSESYTVAGPSAETRPRSTRVSPSALRARWATTSARVQSGSAEGANQSSPWKPSTVRRSRAEASPSSLLAISLSVRRDSMSPSNTTVRDTTGAANTGEVGPRASP